MDYQHTKHYSVEEACDLLPTLRNWFEEIDALTDRIHEFDEFLAPRTNQGEDLGGTAPNQMIRDMARVHALFCAFYEREIKIMDPQMGWLASLHYSMNGKCFSAGDAKNLTSPTGIPWGQATPIASLFWANHS